MKFSSPLMRSCHHSIHCPLGVKKSSPLHQEGISFLASKPYIQYLMLLPLGTRILQVSCLMAEVTTEICVLVVQEPNLVEITYFQVDFVSQHFIDFKFYTDPMVSINSTLALHRIYGEEMTHGVYNAHKHGTMPYMRWHIWKPYPNGEICDYW